ncbi:MAG: isoprenyl transferase [Flavobacteriales bacterium]
MEEELKKQINPQRVPEHIAIIMDGNGRWAKERNKDRIYGHSLGTESVRKTLIAASEIGVKYLTLYAFSTENWNRPEDEINALMDLLVKTIAKEVEELNKNEVRLRAMGNIDKLPEKCRDALDKAIRETCDNKRIDLILALNYSSKWDITNSVKKISQKIKNRELKIEDIDQNMIRENLSTNIAPDPELLIRTSGEKRLSNYLLWELAYAELYFTETLWPDFNKEQFFNAIIDFQNRERRFGKISEQITYDQ